MAITQQSPTGPQLMFFAYVTSNISNFAGASANPVIVFDAASINVGTCYNTSTGAFTVPVTGNYKFETGLGMANWGAQTSCNWFIQNTTNSNQYSILFTGPLLPIVNNTGTINLRSTMYPALASLTAGDVLEQHLSCTDSTQTITLTGDSSNHFTFWACYKVT